jgi:hypothetical protein
VFSITLSDYPFLIVCSSMLLPSFAFLSIKPPKVIQKSYKGFGGQFCKWITKRLAQREAWAENPLKRFLAFFHFDSKYDSKDAMRKFDTPIGLLYLDCLNTVLAYD